MSISTLLVYRALSGGEERGKLYGRILFLACDFNFYYIQCKKREKIIKPFWTAAGTSAETGAEIDQSAQVVFLTVTFRKNTDIRWKEELWKWKKQFRGKTTGNERKNKEARKQREADLQAVFDENQIVAAAKVNTREVELDNDRDAEEEHLMDAVYDAMIKGPHNSMDFQRDFIAEGMDMLNSFDL